MTKRNTMRQHLRRLRQVRSGMLSGALGALLATAGWHAFGQSDPLMAQPDKKPPEEIVVRGIALVDETGKTRARLRMNDLKMPEFSILDSRERPWIRLGANDSAAQLLIAVPGKDTEARLSLMVDTADGGPVIALSSTDDVNRIDMDASGKIPGISLSKKRVINDKREGTAIGLHVSADSAALGVVPFGPVETETRGLPEGMLLFGFEKNGPLQIRRVEGNAGPVWPKK